MQVVKFEDKEFSPSKIVCVGRNYHEHIVELENEVPENIVFFLKPNSSVSNDIIFNHEEEISYEGELCFIVEGSKIVGVGFGFDLTKRKLQSKLKAKQLPWERAKAFDNSAVFSEFVRFNKIPDIYFKLYKNDKLIQEGGYFDMLNKPHTILNEAKTFLTLNDGDIIMTGTPKGVGQYNKNDIFFAKVFEDGVELIKEKWIVK